MMYYKINERRAKMFKNVLIIVCLAFSLMFGTAYAEDVVIGWDANTASDLIGYNVYRATTPDGQTIGNVEENPHFLDYVICYANDTTCAEYTDLDVPYDATLYWVVTAIDSSSNESGKSNEVSVTTSSEPDTTPPSNPTGCYIKAIIP